MPNSEEQSRKERARARVTARFDSEPSSRLTRGKTQQKSRTIEEHAPVKSRMERRTQRNERMQRNTQDTQEDRPVRQRASAAKQAEQLGVGAVAQGLLERFGLKFIAVVAVIALLVISFFIGSVLRSCSNEAHDQAAQSQTSTASSANTSPVGSPETASTTTTSSSAGGATSASTASSATSTQTNASSNSAGQPDVLRSVIAKLAEQKSALDTDPLDITDVLEESLASQLQTQAKANTDSAWILANPSAYAMDGWAVQYKILKLAAEEPAATTYARNWPDEYPAYDQNLQSKNALSTTGTGSKKIPQLYQWDPRWGYTVYSSTAFGMTGCCPTAFAMVYQGLTGKTDMTPYDMGVLAERDGYMSQYEGTDAYFLINEASGLGLNCWELYPDASNMVAALESGQVLIVNVGPGDFTTDGHFIVVTGLQDGKLIVNDPYSKLRSERLWTAEEIALQSKAVFAYTAL